MFPLKRILFPVDFSERCRGAAGFVEALVGRFDAELILLHVIEPPTYSGLLEGETHIGDRQFDAFLDGGLDQLRVERLVERGEAATKIVECSRERRVDLIMMPTQGLGIYRRLIIGSNTAKVLHDADCPVWTGVHLEDAPPLEAIACRRILCAVDLKAASPRVLDWAQHLADEYQADLTLLHVTPGYGETVELEIQRQARASLEALKREAGSSANVSVESGDAARVVASAAGRWNANLLVIGRRAEEGILGRLEMTAYSIIRQSPCPVVSV